MKNTIKTFSLFVKPDNKSLHVAESLRRLNADLKQKFTEITNNGDIIIAVGGDGTFIDAVTSTKFDKTKVYAGIHTGTLGFFQNISPDDISELIKYLSHKSDINTRKIHVSSVKILLKDGTERNFFSLNEVLIVGQNYSKISFAEHINGELLQNVTGNGIIIATNTGDTAYSLNSGGAIDFSSNFQLVCTLETPIRNAAYERFITNPIICSKINIVLKPSNNVNIIIDGINKNIDSSCIDRIEVSMLDDSNYINKLEIQTFSKANIIRNKILGYDF